MMIRPWTLILAISSLAGCANDPTHVIASTATVIGVDLGQGQATQTITGTLGYKRAEFALVPTNKAEPAAGSGAGADGVGSNVGGGATDVADVVLELNYKGIFSSGGGIYQRLAVGRNAVMAPAAQAMFLKDPGGAISAEAMAIATQGAAISGNQVNIIAKCFDNAGNVNTTVRDQVITQAKAKSAVQFSATSVAALKSQVTTADFADFLRDLGDGMVPGLFEALPATCK